MAPIGRAFFDTSVLLGGIVDLGPSVRHCQAIMQAVADEVLERPATAWHCCLEFYAVVTRVPAELRLTPVEAGQVVEEELLARFDVYGLPAEARLDLVRAAAEEGIAGGRLYDAHIAEIAHRSGTSTLVTDNPRHFGALRRRGVEVVSSMAFARAEGIFG